MALLGAIAFNVADNLTRQATEFGFDFLWQPAGFSILQSLIPFDERSSYGRAFVVGLLNTLLVAVVGIAVATPLGFGLGVARLAPNRALRLLGTGYVELIRNLPLLLILFFLYFGVLRQLPSPRQSLTFSGAYLNIRGLFVPAIEVHSAGPVLMGIAVSAVLAFLVPKGRARSIALAAATIAVAIAVAASATISWPEPKGLSIFGGWHLIPEFVALAAALSLYTAAYIAEIVRAGIESISRHQRDAAQALGLTGWQATRFVVIPQALRLIIPPLTSQYLNLTKNSSLAVAIAYPDLVSVFAGTTLAQTGKAVEIMGITMGVYLTLSLSTAAILNWRNASISA
jgi:general L-amino acid transport system permease protein